MLIITILMNITLPPVSIGEEHSSRIPPPPCPALAPLSAPWHCWPPAWLWPTRKAFVWPTPWSLLPVTNRRSPTHRQASASSVRKTCSATATATLPRRWMALREWIRSEEHTSELQSRENLVCRLLL